MEPRERPVFERNSLEDRLPIYRDVDCRVPVDSGVDGVPLTLRLLDERYTYVIANTRICL